MVRKPVGNSRISEFKEKHQDQTDLLSSARNLTVVYEVLRVKRGQSHPLPSQIGRK